MTNLSKKVLLLVLVFSSFNIAQNINENFDFSGMNQFWKITSILETNREPSNEDWHSLFSTSGYKVLTSGEFTREFFVQNFKLVFMPSLKKELTKTLKSGRNIHFLEHYIKVRDNKKKIKNQQLTLQRNSYNRSAVSKTMEYLPFNTSQYPPVAFVIFESNGRGSSPIVVDLAATLEWDFMGFLSHEFHHWYRNKNLQYDIYKIKHEDNDLVDALAKIEAEGIADMVDKKDWFSKSSNSISSYARQFINEVGRAPYVINNIDQLILQIVKTPSLAKSKGKEILNSLPQSGHTSGYFMASLILENIGKNALVETVGNPFDFILLYNKAAEKSRGRYPVFSEDSIKYIKQLKIKYAK